MIPHLIHSNLVCPEMSKQYPRIVKGEGVYLYDEKGKRYMDASCGAAGVSNIGHGNTIIADIIREQTALVSVLPTHAFSSPVVENYLEHLVGFAPEGFEKAWTVMSGTEAVENALKLALQYHQLRGEPQRYKIISRWSTYHGNSIFTLDVGGMKLRRQSYAPWLQNFPHLSPAYAYRHAQGMEEDVYVASLVNEFERTILEHGSETIAAFIAEPVVAAALGAVPPPAGYFKAMAEVCSTYGILFIADEVLTGFGRLGSPFGIQTYGVIPDIIAAGKGISGGYYPLSAVLASAKVMEPFVNSQSPFLGGHTFACNPVGAAVGDYVIRFMEENMILQNVQQQGKYLKDKLTALKKFDIVGDVRGEGLLLGIELVMDKITRSPFPSSLQLSKKIGDITIESGVVLYPGRGSADGILGDHIMISPPLIMNESHADELVSVLESAITSVLLQI